MNSYNSRRSWTRKRVAVPDILVTVPLSDDDTRELSRVSKQVRSFTERRNRMIREKVAAGAGVREVARACGLDHTTVLNIIKPKDRP